MAKYLLFRTISFQLAFRKQPLLRATLSEVLALSLSLPLFVCLSSRRVAWLSADSRATLWFVRMDVAHMTDLFFCLGAVGYSVFSAAAEQAASPSASAELLYLTFITSHSAAAKTSVLRQPSSG